jgi:pseudouridine kinase
MNAKEQQVLQLLKENPYYSQQEMAEILSVSRPTLANIISSLIKAGDIVGRGYVLREHTEILAVGGANVDRKFHIEGETKLATSNPSTVSYSVGGVARNIAENLGRLKHDVQLVTVLGQDHDAELILNDSATYMKFSYTERLLNVSTGSYSAVLDHDGELVVALANMAIYDEFTSALIQKHEVAFKKSKLIVIDLNCPKETVAYVQSLAKAHHVPLVVVPVSTPKMNRMPNELSGVTYFICNKDEAETYLNMTISTDQDYERATEKLAALGCEHVVITCGSNGVVARVNHQFTRYEAKPVSQIVDVTGAGDAFVSGLIHGVLMKESFDQAIQLGLVNASRTLQSKKTVRSEMNRDELTNWREKI